MADPTPTASRRHQKCVDAMLADPDLYGDLLLIGIVLAGEYHLAAPRSHPSLIFGPGTRSVTANADGTDRVYDSRVERWRGAMRADIRRYDHRHDPAYQRHADPGPTTRPVLTLIPTT